MVPCMTLAQVVRVYCLRYRPLDWALIWPSPLKCMFTTSVAARFDKELHKIEHIHSALFLLLVIVPFYYKIVASYSHFETLPILVLY